MNPRPIWQSRFTWLVQSRAGMILRVMLIAMLGMIAVGPSSVASAQSAPGIVTVAPTSGPPGTVVTVTFTSPQTLLPCILIAPPPAYVVWDNTIVLAQVTTRPTVCSSFAVPVTVPANAPGGPHNITVREGSALTGPILGSAPFAVIGGIGVPPPPIFLPPPPPPILVPPPPPPPYPPYLADHRRWMLPLRFALGIEVPVRLNVAPSCGIDGPSTMRVGETATFSSTAADRDGFVKTERWHIEGPETWDQPRTRGESITFTARVPGTHAVQLHVADNGRARTSCVKAVTVG
jgi:hypothetical protein